MPGLPPTTGEDTFDASLPTPDGARAHQAMSVDRGFLLTRGALSGRATGGHAQSSWLGSLTPILRSACFALSGSGHELRPA